MKRHLWLILTLLLIVQTPALAAKPRLPQPEPVPIAIDDNGTKTITFQRAVFRIVPNLFEGSTEFILEANELMKAYGYNVQGGDNPLFEEKEQAKANLQLGCIIKNIAFKRHSLLNRRNMTIKLQIEWQLYDALQKKVIYRSTLTGSNPTRDIPDKLMFDAFINSLKKLLADPQFVSLVANSNPPQPVTETSLTKFPPLTVNLVKNDIEFKLPEQMSTILDAVAKIRVGDALASGVFISNDGYLLTAAHVVAGVSEVMVDLRSGITLPAQVLRVDNPQDIALIKVAGSGYPALPLALNANPPVGSETYVIGTPADEEFVNSVSKGIVSGLRKLNGFYYIQTDASVSPGCSGGPLLNKKGQVIGITSWKIVALGFEGLAFGIPLDVIGKRLNITWN
jgi:S1-C subfamily serine protease